MDNDKKSSSKNMKIAPATHNDQLGENASVEFAQDYDNKSNAVKTKNQTKNSAK